MRIRLPNNWTPRPYQRAAWDYLERGGRHAELVWHRRAGKDELCLHRTAVAAFERVAGYWHMLPEYAQARKAIWLSVNPHTGKRRIDEAFPTELRRATREHEMQIEFVNGSTWQVVGSDRFDSLVGAAPAGIVYSEWALSNPNARAYFRPIIAENGGWQIFITTPRGRNHAQTTLKAARGTPGAFAQVLDATETGVFAAAQLDAELAAYLAEFGEDFGRAKFEQEYTRYVGTESHFLCVSRARIGHYHSLAVVMAHEMIHLLQAVKKTETRGEHNADFRRRAALVCRTLGFDPKTFC